MTSRVDLALIRKSVDEFPGAGWTMLNGSILHAPTAMNPHARRWDSLTKVQARGGNYAFLFPEAMFAEELEIQLDGPGQRKIPFRFSSQTHPVINGLLVTYVGKAANLHQRFQWHFSLSARNTGAQVQYGLVKAGLCADRAEATRFMLKHSVIVYRELHGDEHAANRDLLEMSLCVRFAPPFNIKSEH